jgi:hypothetical protein
METLDSFPSRPGELRPWESESARIIVSKDEMSQTDA